MERIFQPLLFFLARCSRNQLIRQIEFLKAENEMLRKRVPKQAIILKREEREQLINLGESIGPGLAKLITIVRYKTYRRWIRQMNNQAPIKRMGRPRTAESTRQLVLKLDQENHWGLHPHPGRASQTRLPGNLPADGSQHPQAGRAGTRFPSGTRYLGRPAEDACRDALAM